jgi:DnaJ-class molecular chaperone
VPQIDVSDQPANTTHHSTVLNVTKDATQAEVHERYRSLSLVFHPDKQTDEQLKAAATKEFLKIQKAYQG